MSPSFLMIKFIEIKPYVNRFFQRLFNFGQKLIIPAFIFTESIYLLNRWDIIALLDKHTHEMGRISKAAKLMIFEDGV